MEFYKSRSPIVYFRRKFRRKKEGFCEEEKFSVAVEDTQNNNFVVNEDEEIGSNDSSLEDNSSDDSSYCSTQIGSDAREDEVFEGFRTLMKEGCNLEINQRNVQLDRKDSYEENLETTSPSKRLLSANSTQR